MAGTITRPDWRRHEASESFVGAELGASLYRRVLLLYVVVVFYTGMMGILFRFGILPLYTQVLLAACALPLVLSPHGVGGLLKSPLLWWALCYSMTTALWFMISTQPPTATSMFRGRFLSMVFLVSLMIILADSRVHHLARKLVLYGVLFEVVLLVLQLFVSIGVGTGAERATALHDNPNAAGAALLTGWIVSNGILERQQRHWLAILVGIGAFLTFSRGAIVVWAAITALMLWQGRLRGSVMMVTGVKLGLAMVFLITISGKWAVVGDSVLASFGESKAISRLSVLSEWDVTTNPGTSDRVDMLRRGWAMFSENPLLGQGLGATLTWSDLPSTHNTMLRHLAEQGVIGFVLYPAFILAVIWRAPPAFRNLTTQMAVFLLLRSLVSHNALDDKATFVSVVLLAAMVVDARLRSEEGQPYTIPGEHDDSAVELAPRRARESFRQPARY